MTLSRPPYLFLLGGHDLEMAEIKELLKEHKLPFHDRDLRWDNARLSAYKDLLDQEHFFVGIELSEDISLPPHYLSIDHHNERSYEPASIEQVAELLGIELNRWQQLVAANDRGFIPAMEGVGATKEEITRVRKADRQAQGVTEEDERLAKESIEKHKRQDGRITIIKSLTPKFSPISDRMYGEAASLIVYNDETLVYYGAGIQHLSQAFTNLINSGKAYCGGGANGYFGLAAGEWKKEEIEKMYTMVAATINNTQDE